MATDFSSLSKQELIALVKKKDARLLETKKKIGSLEAKLYKSNLALEKALRELEEKKAIIRKAGIERFFTKAEKLPRPIINEAETLAPKKSSHQGRPLGSKNFASLDLEKMSEANPIKVISPNMTNCPKGCFDKDKHPIHLLKAGEDISYEISVIPTRYIVTKIVREKLKCPFCGSIYEVPSSSIFGHSPLTPSLAADILDKKYELGIPLDRYSRKLVANGIPLSTETLSEWVLTSSELLKPIYLALRASLANTSCGVINADETPLKVLSERKTGRKNSYIFVYCSSYFEHSMYLYDFSLDRKMKQTKELLKNFKGTIICDGYSGYEDMVSENKNIKLQYCYAHARRYFFDAYKSLPKKAQDNSSSKPIIAAFDSILGDERKMREEAKSPEKIKEIRNSSSYLSKLDSLERLVNSLSPITGSKLDKAKKYFLNHWETGMKTFLSDGHIDLTNNLAERAVKPFAICRRNFLFSKTPRGAEASALIFSLIQSALANNLNAERYLEWALTNINKLSGDELLPWSNKIPEDIRTKTSS